MVLKFYVSCFFIFVQMFLCLVHSQTIPATPPVDEQALENLTQSNDDVETEDDTFLQDMQQFVKYPINLNTANESDLNKLKILSPLQLHSFFTYKTLLGNFINIYELQAVPGWDVLLIRKIKLFVTVDNSAATLFPFNSRLKNGESTFLTRITQVLEKSKGYLADSLAHNFYPGSPQKLLLRYKYQYKTLLQYGITAEKDAGEQFFKGKQPTGFDFYSAHFFVRDLGRIKSLAIGDFIVNLGQGLVQWQGLAFKKGPQVLNIKRQDDILRPYNSAGEVVFHRGAGITMQKRSLQATGFVSYRKLDANFNRDTLQNNDFVSSLQTSGYHRTPAEVEDKNSQGQFTFGGNLSITKNNFHLGLNTVHYSFRYPIIKSGGLYNKFALNGTNWSNSSLDYSFTVNNFHLFGEAALDKNFNRALVNGLLISTDARVDLSFLYRKISRAYQSLYTNAFTESTFPANESGFYTGISLTPVDAFKIDAYVDLYRFPWLKLRVNAPSTGKDYMVQVTYKPNKQVEFYARYRTESKAINYNPEQFALSAVVNRPKQSWRNQVIYKISPSVTLRTRVELLFYDKKDEAAENGFLIFQDVLYKPLMKPYSANIRLQYFETDGYNSRLYAYENDVLYSFSIPVFYEKGYRYYLNLNYDVAKNISVWLRFAQTIFPGKTKAGSGLDEINSNKKSELKLQSLFNL